MRADPGRRRESPQSPRSGGAPGPRPPAQARHRLTVTVLDDLVDVLDAIAVLAGRPPADVVAELVVEGLRQAELDPDVHDLVSARRRRRLRLVGGA